PDASKSQTQESEARKETKNPAAEASALFFQQLAKNVGQAMRQTQTLKPAPKPTQASSENRSSGAEATKAGPTVRVDFAGLFGQLLASATAAKPAKPKAAEPTASKTAEPEASEPEAAAAKSAPPDDEAT
ncbi:MAG: hypothetical protein KDI55_27860, partial [Anaerolineae bacterium]|nr:hypothetical protein [Anaerolineae bacterium]